MSSMPTQLINKKKYAFPKSERLCSRKCIENLFSSASCSLSAYPLRAVFLRNRAADAAEVQILVSVSKRRLRHAVDRNRVKRLIREVYRLNKHILWQDMRRGEAGQLVIAFLYLSNAVESYALIEKKMNNLLQRIREHIKTTSDEAVSNLRIIDSSNKDI